VLRLSWTHYTTTVSRGVIALLFSLDNWWEVRSLHRRVCEPSVPFRGEWSMIRRRAAVFLLVRSRGHGAPTSESENSLNSG
jgi:hypothetical protein